MKVFALAALVSAAFASAEPAPSACVSGAGGFVSTEIIYQLLELGWEVHATVRSLAKKEKYTFLNDIAEKFKDKGGKLVLHEADLAIQGSFDECIMGRDYFLHPATIFSLGEDDPYIYYETAVQGSKNVLTSVKKTLGTDKPIKRVVATMSIFSIFNLCNMGFFTCPKTQKPKNGKVFTEEDWSHTRYPDGGYTYTNAPAEAYGRSKVDQDKFTREFCDVHGIDCVTIHPGLIIGPPRGTRVSGVSLNTIQAMAAGKAYGNIGIVGDNRDVAIAHIKAAITPEASGRYIVSNYKMDSNDEMDACLDKRFPGFAFGDHPAGNVSPPFRFSSKRFEELVGRPVISHCQSWGDAIQGMYDMGLAANPGQKKEL